MKIFIIILTIFLFIGCAGKSVSLEEEIKNRFEKGIEYFQKEKYSKAKEEFQFVIMNNPGSRIALDSQFYLGESLFKLNKFGESAIEFDYYARFSQNYDQVERSRFRICECAVNMTFNYPHDQSNTIKAIEKLQNFIEDYSESKFKDTAEDMMEELRNQIAKKGLESARLYLKLEEYESARIYLQDVLTNYYDSNIVDDVRIAYIFSYILEEKRERAIGYLENEYDNFLSEDKILEAEGLIENTRDGLGLNDYIRLYK